MKNLKKFSLIIILFLSIIACSDDDTGSAQNITKKTFRVEINPLVEASQIERIGIVFQVPPTSSNLNINGTFQLIEEDAVEFKQYQIEFTDVDSIITIETTEEIEKPLAFTMVIFMEEQNTGADLDVLNFKGFKDNELFYERNVQVFTNLQQGLLELEFNNW